ncbi:MAG: hypothetical protein ACRDJE_18215 [Dehalococcoidia bacterium]
MAAERILTCPRCSTVIGVAPLAMPLVNELNGEVTGAVLKRCPECRVWSWMTLERQPAE